MQSSKPFCLGSNPTPGQSFLLFYIFHDFWFNLSLFSTSFHVQYKKAKKHCRPRGSNPRPSDLKSDPLTTEPFAYDAIAKISIPTRLGQAHFFTYGPVFFTFLIDIWFSLYFFLLRPILTFLNAELPLYDFFSARRNQPKWRFWPFSCTRAQKTQKPKKWKCLTSELACSCARNQKKSLQKHAFLKTRNSGNRNHDMFP